MKRKPETRIKAADLWPGSDYLPKIGLLAYVDNEMMRLAIADLQLEATDLIRETPEEQASEREAAIRSAALWVWGKGVPNYPLNFEPCCERLGLDIDAVRERFRSILTYKARILIRRYVKELGKHAWAGSAL